MSGSSSIISVIYQNVFKRTSTFALLIGVTAVFADRVVDVVCESAFEKINEGHLWKDVKKQLNSGAPKG